MNQVQQQAEQQKEQVRTHDAFVNFAARLGLGSDNQSSYGGYSFSPITRNRMMLDLAYRGSWICRMAVKAISDDMTREGITLGSDLDPELVDILYTAFNKKFLIWDKLTEAISWGRLYGGAGAIILIDGQDMSTPLRPDTVGPGQFCGILPVDRWMVDPSLFDLVTDLKSPDLGLPKYYNVIHDAPAAPRQRVHHSRFIRFEGDDLPYYQKLSENLWGLSVLEPIFDRIMAFDSATTGTAQLVYRAHLRTYGIKGLRSIIAKGGAMLDAVYQQVDMMRMWQNNEGITLMDGEDQFEASQYSFGGLDSVLVQMGQQISGALQIPLIRLFGQSPTGFNSTGESDLRIYYDGVRTQQERRLRPPLEKLIRVVAKSEAVQLPKNFNFEFVPLWQMTTEQKSSVNAQTTGAILQAFDTGAIGRGTVLKELRKISTDTGIWTTITDEEVDEAEKEPKPPSPGEQPQGEGGMGGLGGMMGGSTEPPRPPKPKSGAGGSSGAPAPETQGEDAIPPQRIDNFLPGNVIPLRNFLPGGVEQQEKQIDIENVEELDSAGSMLQHELEKLDKEAHKALYAPPQRRDKQLHFHFDDRDQAGAITEFAGIPVVIEFRQGESRDVGSSDGATMLADYGYLVDTKGYDGDSIDVFLGPKERSENVYVIEVKDPDNDKFIQHKVFLGFEDARAVEFVFHAFYNDGRNRLLAGDQMTMSEFKTWLQQFRYSNPTPNTAAE